MAQLTPVLVLVGVLLITPQLAAAQWAYLFRGFNAKAFAKGLEKGFDIGSNLFGSSSPDVRGKNNGDTNCPNPTKGLQAPLIWTDDMAGYVVELRISGTAKAYNFLVATANNFVWTDQCWSFPASAVMPQACNSKQCGLLQIPSPCDMSPLCRYATQQMNGFLTNSSFTLTNSKPFNLSFGCNVMASSYAGVYNRVAGLGRGPLSLTSQLQVSKFSYCFTNFGDASISGHMFFGSYAFFDEGTKSVATTPFQLTANRYSIKLTGISVGRTTVAWFPATQVFIDSSTPLTYLDIPVYTSFKNAISKIISLELPVTYNPPYDMCFYLPLNVQLEMPEITFNFGDAKMNFPIRNFLFHYADDASGSVFCFALMRNLDANGYAAGFSVLGSFQQQNIQFIYDLQNGALSFASVNCGGLRPRSEDIIVPCRRPSSRATSNGPGVELGGRVVPPLPFIFFFYYLFVPFLLV